MVITIDADTLRERIRERSDESGWRICPNCDCGLKREAVKIALRGRRARE